MRAVIYTRVSTQEQVSNQSLGVQERACREHCERQSWQVLRVFVEEGESAKTADRTQLKELLAFCRQERPDFLVVYALDRFARNMEDHVAVRALLRKCGVQLRAVNAPIGETPEAKFLESVLAAAAELDNGLRAAKTRDGMRAAAEKGRWIWKAPVGYLMASGEGGKNLAPDPRRAPLIRQAFELMATGLYQRNAVLEQVTGMGLVTLKGVPLTPQTFAATLSNPLYCGRLVAQSWGIDRIGTWEPIVEPELWYRVQGILAGLAPTAAPTHSRRNPEFALRAVVFCAACERPLTGSFSRSKNKLRYPYYHCPGRCTAVLVRREKLESEFLALLDRLRPQPGVLALFRDLVVGVWEDSNSRRREQADLLRQRIAELDRKRERLDEVYIYQGGLSREVYEEQGRRLADQAQQARIDLQGARADSVDPRPVVAFAVRVLSNAARMWSAADLDRRQRLQKALFPSGLLYAGGIRTPVRDSIFYELGAISEGRSGLVSPTGFEPVLPP